MCGEIGTIKSIGLWCISCGARGSYGYRSLSGASGCRQHESIFEGDRATAAGRGGYAASGPPPAAPPFQCPGALRSTSGESRRLGAPGTKARIAEALRQFDQDLRSQCGATGAIVCQELQLQGYGRGFNLSYALPDHASYSRVLGV